MPGLIAVAYFNVNTISVYNLRRIHLETNFDPFTPEIVWQWITYHPYDWRKS